MFTTSMTEIAVFLLLAFVLSSIIGSIFSGTSNFFETYSFELVIALAIIVVIVSIAVYLISKKKYFSITHIITMIPASILLICELIEAIEGLASAGGDILLFFGIFIIPLVVIFYGIIFAIILLFAFGIPMACEYADSEGRYVWRNLLIGASFICAVAFIMIALNSTGWQYILMTAK